MSETDRQEEIEDHRRRHVRAHQHAAAVHDQAAALHQDAAEFFDEHGKREQADKERALAERETQGGLDDRKQANEPPEPLDQQ